MLDLKGQYQRLKTDIDTAIQEVIDSSQYINGPVVEQFESSLARYLGSKYVISCANGTDAIQIALMSLEMTPGDEVIIPSFNYISTAEVVVLLGLTPVMIDVDEKTFNCTAEAIEDAITSKTKVIVPVHLFGQSCPMEEIMSIANKHQLYVIEDNAQSIGASYQFTNGTSHKTGTIGHIGCTSFFPSKNLGCFGDGGAMYTDDDQLAEKMRMISKHGQQIKYHHELLGCNSRLDAIQAAVLNVKLNHLDSFLKKRQQTADIYDDLLPNVKSVIIPQRASSSVHTFNQYTLRIINGHRDSLREHLTSVGIATAIYYPIPLYNQKAFGGKISLDHEHTERLCESVLSIPLHTELSQETQHKIVDEIRLFFKFI